jgi:2-oxoglutarate dehydrogenase E1 component
VDYPLAEHLAFATLLVEGTPVRLSGEDSQRGTFSQRHAVWWDTESREPRPYAPLNNLQEGQAGFSVYDSPLSEYSVLGFEYGYALAGTGALVLWEAQFGDFSNGAQVITDNYLCSGEAKWGSRSGLVMLLPHGYEGQGPDHSTAHLERYLQLCAEGNIQVCNTTTPAQYFHLLRRQARLRERKPLVIMMPKSLLRHPLAVSTLEELGGGGFRKVLDDPDAEMRRGPARKICFCSGKLYYELLQRREELGEERTALVRIEQLYPFPARDIAGILRSYPSDSRLWWVQEEPYNRGAWHFVRDRFLRDLGVHGLGYLGRRGSASPATGSHARHVSEQKALVDAVFGKQEEPGNEAVESLSLAEGS